MGDFVGHGTPSLYPVDYHHCFRGLLSFLSLSILSPTAYIDKSTLYYPLNYRGCTPYCDQNRDPPIEMRVGLREGQPQDREKHPTELEKERQTRKRERERERASAQIN